MLRLLREMWGVSPVNKRSQRLADDGSCAKGTRLPTTPIDKNRVKRSARSALVFRQSMGVLLNIEGNFPRLRAKLAHMVGHLPEPSPWAAPGKFGQSSTKSNRMIDILAQ
jgi:hypothetical protein